MNYSLRGFGTGLMLTLLLALPLVLGAQSPSQPAEERELPQVSRTYVITNAVITQAPGRRIERGNLVIRDGLIQAVGKNVAAPPEAIVIKGDSLFVYAGFIDGLSRVGVIRPKEDPAQSRDRPKDPGHPAPEVAGITPQNDVRSVLNPSDKPLEDLRAAGFGVSQIVPYGGMLPGAAAIALLKGKSGDEMVLVGKFSLYSELTPAQRVYPATVIGIMAKWRELYRQALQAKEYDLAYSSNRTGLVRPPSDRILEAFYPVIEKRMPVLFRAEKYLEAERVLTLQREFAFPLIIAGLKDGWDATSRIKTSGTKVFLSLELPDEIKKPDPKKDSAARNEKPNPEKDALEKRKKEAILQYEGQAATFQKAGIPFGFSTLTVKPTDIHKNLRRMISAGLSEDQALAALTTTPAQLLGLSDRLGTIDNGKIANLVLSDKPFFDEKARVRMVFVDGVPFRYDVRPATTTPSVVINIEGTWSVTTQTLEGTVEDKVTFKKEGNAFAGSITGTRFQQAVPLENVELTGNKLKYSYTTQAEGQSIRIDVDVNIEGATFKGSSTAGRFGSFAVEGKKDPNK